MIRVLYVVVMTTVESWLPSLLNLKWIFVKAFVDFTLVRSYLVYVICSN